MKVFWKSGVWLLFIAESVIAFCAGVSDAQTMVDASGDSKTLTPITLWMKWQRGNGHYGPNFIYLRTPCQSSETCECSMSFKATNSQEFADYISSFGGNKVPVVYEVLYGPNGRARTNKLASVGTWTSDRFPANDRLIGVSAKFEGSAVGARQTFKLHGSEDCFPPSAAPNANPPGRASSQAQNGAVNPTVSGQQQEDHEHVAEWVPIPQSLARGLLIKKVQPEYPQEARDKRIQGTVILAVYISEEGDVTETTLVSGHQLLVPAATEAVKQWKYKPYSVKGEPVAVKTQVNLSFRLPKK
jgi:TonB family protein